MKAKTKRILITLTGTILGVVLAKAMDKNQSIGLAIGSTAGHLLAEELVSSK